ncbi:MAG TPA: winged helix-turn-helix domain-containing protein [Candidatus Paceibacterota bacterium]|nr:winged helix-turn-helix domain-containing protein [Candidatus Paceibacterota bacterium]
MKAIGSKQAAARIYSNIFKNTGIVSDPKKKTPKQLERHIKGVANHRRIAILLLVAKEEGITLDGIAQSLDCNFKTISEHSHRLVRAGLIEKKYIKNNVAHSLTPYGKTFVLFLNSF